MASVVAENVARNTAWHTESGRLHLSRIADILIEQGRAAADARRQSGALWGQTVSNLSQVPGQIMADRRAADAARVRAETEQQRLNLAKRAADREETAFTTEQEERRKKAAGEWAEKLLATNPAPDSFAQEVDRAGIWTPEEAEALKGRGATPEGVKQTLTMIAPFKAAARLPNREIKTRDAAGNETIQIVPDTAGQTFTSAAPPKPPDKKYEVTVPGPGGKPVRKLVTESELASGVTQYERPRAAPAGSGDVTDVSDAAIERAAVRLRKTGVMPTLGMGDKTARQRIMNREATLTPEDVARVEASGGDIATNKATYTADSASLRDLTKVLDASSAFTNTMHDNFNMMKKSAEKIIDTGSPWLNQPLRVFDKNVLGSEGQAAFETYRAVVVPEAAKILSSPTAAGQLTDSARKEMEAIVSGGGTLKQLMSVADALEKDAANKRKNYQAQINEIKKRMSGGGATGNPTGSVKIKSITEIK